MQSLQEHAVDWWSALEGYLCCLPASRGAPRPQGGAQQEDSESAIPLSRVVPLPCSECRQVFSLSHSLAFSYSLAQIWQTSVAKHFLREEGEGGKTFFEGFSKNHGPQQNCSPSANFQQLTTCPYIQQPTLKQVLPTTKPWFYKCTDLARGQGNELKSSLARALSTALQQILFPTCTIKL